MSVNLIEHEGKADINVEHRSLNILWCWNACMYWVHTQRCVPAHGGDGAWDAALGHARWAGLVSGEQALYRGCWRAKRLSCFRTG